jgi:peptidoglycan/xylan/chitin deacetylase (PgdA/CDA1 family)
MMIRARRPIVGALRAFRPKPMVLMYHRIAEPAYDPWGIAVSPAHFDEQLAELGRKRDVMSLAEFGTLFAARKLPKRAIAITFDDGYECNARVAAPILHAHRHPATFFLTTGAIGSELEFWWDELATLLVETCVPVTALITVGAKQFEIDFAAPLVPAEMLKAWHWTSPSRHVRLQNYMDIWREMRALSHTAQRVALDSMWQACSGRPISRDNYRPLTARAVKTLEVAGLFHIAPHSATHTALSGLPEEAQRLEIVSSLEACATLSDNTIAIFSYPYGDNSLITRRIVHEAGFAMACGTEPRVVNAMSDPFAIPRFQVPDLPSLVF